MSRLWCAICDTGLRCVPDRDGRSWLYVAVTTEIRSGAEPLVGFVGSPIFPAYEVTAGSVWATNLLPAATPGPVEGYYGHGIPAGTGWFDPLVGHMHVPGRAMEQVRAVPECCGWPMRLIPQGWVCRVGERCSTAAPVAA